MKGAITGEALPEVGELKLNLKKRKKVVREKTVEGHFKERARARGYEPCKFVSPGHRSRPDQLLLGDVQAVIDMLRPSCPLTKNDLRALAIDVMRATVRFVELKRPGKKPTAEQLREHEALRARGFTVEVIDNPEDAKSWEP